MAKRIPRCNPGPLNVLFPALADLWLPPGWRGTDRPEDFSPASVRAWYLRVSDSLRGVSVALTANKGKDTPVWQRIYDRLLADTPHNARLLLERVDAAIAQHRQAPAQAPNTLQAMRLNTLQVMRRLLAKLCNLGCPTPGSQGEKGNQAEVKETGATGDQGEGQGEGADKRKNKGGKKPLEERNPEKAQVYQRICKEHKKGKAYRDTVDCLKADKQFAEQVREAGLKLNAKLVRTALAWSDQRKRDQARKKQETDPT